MPTKAVCLHCDFVLERAEGESIPSHCPACGSRISCPRCGGTLEQARSQTAAFHCSHCHIDLSGDETRPLLSEGLAPSTLPGNLPVPGFELIGELGHGGMGVVYAAWQMSPRRKVAIKVLPPALAASPRMLDRFRQEAEIGARFLDAHLLPVYDVRESQGVPIIVMPHIEGKDLGRILVDRQRLKAGKSVATPHPLATLSDQAYLDRILPLLDQVIEAVAVLHRENVLHRDIKPSNILVDVKGNCWLSDFGLARLSEGDGQRYTEGGLGTRGYASPEQISDARKVDARSDVFSLAVTLYQVLTLEMPYGKKGPLPGSGAPVPPSRHQRRLRRGFDTVLLKALELEPAERYGTLADFEKNWKLVRADRDPLHGPRPWPGRLLRAGRRYPWQVATGALAAAVLVTLGAWVWGSRHGQAAQSPAPGPAVRSVVVETDPPQAGVVLVPIQPETGAFLENEARRPQQPTPVTVNGVEPGDYLVVAALPDGRFHEVYRHVPDAGEKGSFFGHGRYRDWTESGDGTITWPRIRIPPADITGGMASFKGGDFRMGTPALPDTPPYVRRVRPFYLDTTEVTVAEYRKAMGALPVGLEKVPPPDNYAVSTLSYHSAVDCAEAMGKRLPDEGEYEFAATNGGKTRFPWGDNADLLKSWPIGEVGLVPYDRTPTNPPVRGLFSNVTEWTSSFSVPYPSFGDEETVRNFYTNPALRERFSLARVVRGGPAAIKHGKVDAHTVNVGPEWTPRKRTHEFMDRGYPGLGFRCARSAEPRFLIQH